MYATDFEYDGKYLNDLGYIVCKFNDDGKMNTDSKGSEITFTKAAVDSGKRNRLNGTRYDECLTATFHICKDPDLFDEDLREITRDDFRVLSRWLNRREFCKFRALVPDEEYIPMPFFYASFNLTKVLIGDRIMGVELNMETNAPFGYAIDRWTTYHFAGGDTKIYVDGSDEPGNTYPQMEITIEEAGTLILSNSMTGCEMVIENCTAGEKITLSGDTMIIETSNEDHDIANDFNYDFFSVGNKFGDARNDITASIACTVSLGYEAIVKDTI